MKNKTVLVAGGAGFIGSHTVVELMQAGYEVVVVDNLLNSEIAAIHGVEQIVGRAVTFIEADCCDRVAMEQVFSEYSFNTVIHFAARKAVGESVRMPLAYYHNNIMSLLVILEMMQAHGVENIVFSSSCTVYGQPEVLPVTEQTPRQKAESPYGNTKQISEDILVDAVRGVELSRGAGISFDTSGSAASLHVIALRYFNPIGAHDSALIGELPLGVPANLLPYVTQTAIGRREVLSVYGDDYNTVDGSAVRDYIDVMDLARAHVVAVDRVCASSAGAADATDATDATDNKASYETFNIGTGRGLSVLEIVEAFQRVNGVNINYRITPRREGDIEQIWADTSYANRVLGWRAERSLEQTLQAAWKWELALAKRGKAL